MDRIILDLCGGTGSWSKPYREACYDVRLVTLPDSDVRTYQPPANVHGILAAPPCTEFARCGARWWKSKPPELLLEALDIVRACLRIVCDTRPAWWALENPIGRLKDHIGEPQYIFEPWQFGDPWTKRTWIWGDFSPPARLPLSSRPRIQVRGHRSRQTPRRVQVEAAMRQRLPGAPTDSAALRSMTPPGFAKAFYEANP